MESFIPNQRCLTISWLYNILSQASIIPQFSTSFIYLLFQNDSLNQILLNELKSFKPTNIQ